VIHRLWTTLGIGVAVVSLTALSACGDDPGVTEDLSDEDIVLTPVNDPALNPIAYGNYDGHPNVVAWCDGTARVYTSTRIGADGFQVVPDHPLCQGVTGEG
jgi:hypothetical protein